MSRNFSRVISMICIASLVCTALIGCSGSRNGIDEETIETGGASIENKVEEENKDILSSLIIDSNSIESAIKEHSLINKNFSLSESNDKRLYKYGDTDDYLSEEVSLYTGQVRDGAENIEDSNSTFEVGVTYKGDNEFPSVYSVTFSSKSDIDLENMEYWAFQLAGTIFPPKLAQEYQNYGYNSGDVSEVYSDNGVVASISKEKFDIDGKEIYSMDILLSEGVDEVTYTDKVEFIRKNNSNLGIHNLGLFDADSSIDDIENKVSSILGNEVEAVVSGMMINKSTSGDEEVNISEFTFDTNDGYNTSSSVISYKTTQNDSSEHIELYIQFNSPTKSTKEEAYRCVENTIKNLFETEVRLYEYYNSDKAEVQIISSKLSLQLFVNLNIQDLGDGRYIVGTTITT